MRDNGPVSKHRYDWSKGSHPRIGAWNRAARWVLAGMAAATWPYADFLATRDWTLVFAPLLPTAGAVAIWIACRKVYGVPVAAGAPAVPQPEPRIPCDLDRPYPRPAKFSRKLNSVCPVCGTGDTTGSLGGRVLGWRAHVSCAEWLGDWRPSAAKPVLDWLASGGTAPVKTGGEYAREPFAEAHRALDSLAPPPKRGRARHQMITVDTVLRADGGSEDGHHVGHQMVPQETVADLAGNAIVGIGPEYATTRLQPEQVLYGWRIHIRAATVEEAHGTLAALEDWVRAGKNLPDCRVTCRFRGGKLKEVLSADPVIRRGTGTTNTTHFAGTAVTVSAAGGGAGGTGGCVIVNGSFPIASAADLDVARQMAMTGHITLDEYRSLYRKWLNGF